MKLFAAVASLLVFNAAAFAGGFTDDFASRSHDTRAALRGDWTFENGVAHCVSDPELYKKFANHGPILRWPAEFTDGTLEFEFKPKDCDRIVITLNEDGHVFRMMFGEAGRSRFFGWIGKSSKKNKPKLITKDSVPSVADLDDKWVKAKIVFDGDEAEIVYGEYHETLTHESIGRPKGEFTISFAAGELSVRDVRLVTAD